MIGDWLISVGASARLIPLWNHAGHSVILVVPKVMNIGLFMLSRRVCKVLGAMLVVSGLIRTCMRRVRGVTVLTSFEMMPCMSFLGVWWRIDMAVGVNAVMAGPLGAKGVRVILMIARFLVAATVLRCNVRLLTRPSLYSRVVNSA